MKEPDRLEKFINDNRDSFEDLETSSKSWEMISANLDQNVDRIKSPGVSWIFKRVAAAVIIVLAMYGAYNMVIKVAQTEIATKSDRHVDPAIKEYSEAEAYYASQVNTKVAELEHIAKEHPEVIAEVKEEFELLDKDMKTMKGDLNEGIAQKEIIEAMVQNYRLKLKILENILDQLNTNNNENSSDDDTHTIQT
ncbi:hypothetical protein ACE1ET_13065 [Saccharicrinis sp. FJH62]|uniref:hypothetical protein n=1 Tax=Saccharicrinis sp. FJH62 TaxID=3344657 RepID=UPI0035D4778D